jgi:hypothetical protein
VAKVPNIKVPVTVDASGVDGQLRKVERKFKDSQQRLSKARAAATPAFGALGGGALGGIAGGIGQLGFGGGVAGAGLLAAAAPLLVANRVIEAFATATKGSTEALKQFRDTGVNVTGINSALLETLAAMEARAQKIAGGPTLAQAFLGGAGTDSNMLLEGASLLKDGALGLSAAVGAITSGKTFQEAFLAMQLPTAGESRGEQLKLEMEQAAMQRKPGESALLDIGAAGGFGPVFSLYSQLVRALT